ncbi:hypothetical protein JYT19_00240 [Sulfobacillus acidophilus]|uniref:Uncharacterized protein n=1 Tax=Sulfobacillus acidophilus TaxID=53633 RepID=A0ABS3AVS1_9FIRM|nr:hypothetical protein [Sulfobacillus acidophilus]
MEKIIVALFSMLLLSSCWLVQSEACPVEESSDCEEGQVYSFGPSGNSYNVGMWSFSAEPNTLTNEVKVSISSCPKANLAVPVDYRFQSQTSGQIYSGTVAYPKSSLVTPLKVTLLNNLQYVSSKKITACLHKGSSNINANDYVVMKSKTELLTSDFNTAPTSNKACYRLDLAASSSPSIGSSGWLYTLANELQESLDCVENSIKAIKGEISEKIGETLQEYVEDPCKACQVVSEAILDYEKCTELVGNLAPKLCEAGIATANLEGYSASIASAFCSGASWLGGWGTYLSAKLLSGKSASAKICENKELIAEFLAQYKVGADCMCQMFIKSPKCAQTTVNPECKDLWVNAVDTKSSNE